MNVIGMFTLADDFALQRCLKWKVCKTVDNSKSNDVQKKVV